MSIPKIQYPTDSTKLPSTQPPRIIKYRTFTAREEKLLLMAKQSRKEQDILQAVKQVVQNCVLDPGFNVNKIATVDVEYLFIKLRILSVADIAPMSYTDPSDHKVYEVEVDLKDVEVVGGRDDRTIRVDDKLAFSLTYPNAGIWDDNELFVADDADAFIRLVSRCIDKVYDGDAAIEAQTCPYQEIAEFVESLPLKSYEDVKSFFADLPRLNYVVTYTTAAGEDRRIVLSRLTDFFTFV